MQKARELMLGKIFNVDIEEERKRKKNWRSVFIVLSHLALLIFLGWVMDGCMNDSYSNNHPAPTPAMAQPDVGDPEYFSWMMRNDPQFRKEVEDVSGLED